MHCDQAAEFVSALCDGETIPRSEAEHIGTCAVCQSHLRDYLAMGVELRRAASLETAIPASTRSWATLRNPFTAYWKKGWESMRIPRFAFAALIAGILVLASTLAVDKVRAHDAGAVVMLEIARGAGNPMPCPLSTQDKNHASCASIGRISGTTVGFSIDLLEHDGNRVQLGFRSKDFGAASGSFSLADIAKEPEKQMWFEPGETLKLDIDQTRTLTVTGEWMDHMPVTLGVSNPRIDPSADELRLVSPMLLRDKMVVGDFEGGTTIADKPDWALQLYLPGEGSFLVSLSHLKGAIEGNVNLNRIAFQEAGRSYAFVAGAPITRAQRVWILHEPGFNGRVTGQSGDHWFITSLALVETSQGVWVPKPTTN